MNTFTVQREYPALYRTEVTFEAEDVAAACRAATDVANQSDTWEAHDCERPTYVVAMAKGADVDPWRLTPEGADASVLPVTGLFTDVARIAGYGIVRSVDLVLQLRIMLDAIGGDGSLRIDPKAMIRQCPTGKPSWRTSSGVVCLPRSRAATRVGLDLPVRQLRPAEPARQRDAAHGPPRDVRNLRKIGPCCRFAAARSTPTFEVPLGQRPRCGRLSFGVPRRCASGG